MANRWPVSGTFEHGPGLERRSIEHTFLTYHDRRGRKEVPSPGKVTELRLTGPTTWTFRGWLYKGDRWRELADGVWLPIPVARTARVRNKLHPLLMEIELLEEEDCWPDCHHRMVAGLIAPSPVLEQVRQALVNYA